MTDHQNTPDTRGDEIKTVLRKVRDAGALDDNHGAEDWTLSDQEIERAESSLRQYVAEKVAEAQQRGHWYLKSEQLDAYGNMAHYCRCGYKASQKAAIDGHVEWQKAALHQTEGSES